MDYIAKYWSQIAVIVGVLGYILKTIFDYKLKHRELRNKYFYELKAKKIIELYSRIVEIQMLVDRKKGGEEFERNVFKERIALDQFYWESKFYFSKKTQDIFQQYGECLSFFESKDLMNENPEIEDLFNALSEALIKEFKNEIL